MCLLLVFFRLANMESIYIHLDGQSRESPGKESRKSFFPSSMDGRAKDVRRIPGKVSGTGRIFLQNKFRLLREKEKINRTGWIRFPRLFLLFIHPPDSESFRKFLPRGKEGSIHLKSGRTRGKEFPHSAAALPEKHV